MHTDVTYSNIDQIFTLSGLRSDHWRELLAVARKWSSEKASVDQVKRVFDQLRAIEMLHAYPGAQLIEALAAYIETDQKEAFNALVGRISFSILARYYKEDPHEWEVLPHAEKDIDRNTSSTTTADRPYFEVLVVAPDNGDLINRNIRLMRSQRQKEDEFIYEPLVVNNFQDAFCAIAVNSNICAVAIFDGFDFASHQPVPQLERMMSDLNIHEDDDHLALQLATTLSAHRPELDIYLMSDQRPQNIASDPRSICIRRVLYAVEEPIELHLAILEGVRVRYETPFFDNLKRYAQRPVSTFHALPIARGKSVFHSDWIRDMGQFYGRNLFLAESSATTGGLDSLLEPTGNIKRAQEKAARAFGADHCYFITNGTSTSNKIVLMAVAQPSDIIIVDRNCHKSHHYGAVLGGLLPYYVEAFPMKEYSMYGAVPLRTIKQALLSLKAEGKLDRVRVVDLTNCTFDGHVYNTRRVMEECLAIKPDLVFLWDEAWFGFAHWSPFLRPRTAMGAASNIEAWLDDPASITAYEQQQEALGEQPNDEALLNTRLIPDPRKVKLRVYQTNSTHKSMSAIRQGSMILVKDVDFYGIEPQLHEAVFTHSTTSPNQQLIASMDVARRQMELEGYGLVSNSIQMALDIRNQINKHPLISKYFRVLGADEMIPSEFRSSGFEDFLAQGINWSDAVLAIRDDEFFLDPTRITLICGTAGFDGTQFKSLLADKYEIQVNKTSRNSVLLQTNINNTRSDVAQLVHVLLEIVTELGKKLSHLGEDGKKSFNERVYSLMSDVPDLPNFSYFHETYRNDVAGVAVEGNIRDAFFKSWSPENCEYVGLFSDECDRRLQDGPPMVSAKLVIPYPPGFPILVPGQVISKETISFMRKLDVKEVHGYEANRGLQLLKLSSSDTP
ncbi:COG1982: Arginine/lysine/ornithine decarboxylases [Halomonas citrativorans]|uniref:COG1982: Arginine/lysine/ornithine decarboxylases n=1 Tax=Halomonas citrativorans TaxID=2742612 RepID=A0A1R4HXN9_9GAMM|nr:decarboxylase [Halomonas citrativorans]SJN12226.1 COG1982: Arginine/lysine/ornithine decarboxylases [Halomonas citrativorans]